jgi:methylase of polypeptide subunit release factors
MKTPIQELIDLWKSQMMSDSPAYSHGVKPIYRLFIEEAEKMLQKEKQFGLFCFEAGERHGQLVEQALEHCSKDFEAFYGTQFT